MNMAEYLANHSNDEIEILASESGTKPVYLRQIGSGFRKPSGPLALRIERASGYKVTRSELRPDLYPDESLCASSGRLSP